MLRLYFVAYRGMRWLLYALPYVLLYMRKGFAREDFAMGIDFNQYVGHDIHCLCGRVHSTDVGHIDVGKGSIGRIPAFIEEKGYGHVFIVSDRNTWKAAGQAVEAALLDACITPTSFVLPYDEPVPDEQVIGEILAAYPQETDLVLCVGSGTLNDLCKFVSFRTKVDYLVCATAPSMDGWVSIGAPLILNHMKVTVDTHGPVAVFAEPAVLANAPMRLINAGVGDVLGKYTAILDWHVSRLVNDEYVCDQTVGLVVQALDTVTSNAEAIARREPEAVQSVMDALLLTGLAMAWMGNSRPAAGCEHHMSHVMEMSFQMDGRKAIPHGTKVGIAMLSCIEMYEMLAAEQPDFDAARSRRIDEEAWLANTRRVYRMASPGIEALERKVRRNGTKARNARIDAMEREWPTIQRLIADELPSSREMRALFATLGAPAMPQDEGIDLGLFHDAIVCGRDVRNRWTLLDLLSDLGLIEEYATRACALLQEP